METNCLIHRLNFLLNIIISSFSLYELHMQVATQVSSIEHNSGIAYRPSSTTTSHHLYGAVYCVDQDPQVGIREECGKSGHCQSLRTELDTCTDRVNSRENTAETCTQELYDFMHCVDHCVSPPLAQLLAFYFHPPHVASSLIKSSKLHFILIYKTKCCFTE